MFVSKFAATLMLTSILSVTAFDTVVKAQSRAILGGVAGGLIGGVIAGAIIANQRQQAADAYRYQRADRGAPRRVARTAKPKSGPSNSQNAVVNTAADPFAKGSAAVTAVKASE